MEVVQLKSKQVPAHKIPMAGCFRLGVSVFMIIRNHAAMVEPAYNQAINLVSGETSKINRDTLVEPIEIQATEIQ